MTVSMKDDLAVSDAGRAKTLSKEGSFACVRLRLAERVVITHEYGIELRWKCDMRN